MAIVPPVTSAVRDGEDHYMFIYLYKLQMTNIQCLVLVPLKSVGVLSLTSAGAVVGLSSLGMYSLYCGGCLLWDSPKAFMGAGILGKMAPVELR